MGIFEFCIERKRSIVSFMVLIMLYGLYAYLHIPKEDKPDIKIPIIYVMVTQSGISPEDARKMILQPLENGLQGLEYVKEITSYAYEGAAAIKIEFDAGADPDKSLDDVRNKINDTKNKLPTDADEPIIKQIDLSLVPVLNVVLVSDLSMREILQVARNTRDAIIKIPTVRDVTIAGEVGEAVQIIVKPEMIEKYQLSASMIANIIASNNLLVPAGIIQKKDGAFSVKVPALIDDYKTLLDFPISSRNGKVLKLKDVATVTRDFKDINIITRANGKSAIVLEISKRAGENIIDTVKAAKAVVEEAKKQWPEGLDVIYANDTSNHIMDMVHELENGILFAGLLVLIIIIMAVGIKSALLIALSLPVSFFSCILIMDMCGYTLNIVVLFSLILTVGMVVDDAIVITEYADRKMIEGKSSEESYLEAAKRMFIPIFTATLVKIVVFLPFLVWPGTLGQFMKYMPITVFIIMTNSFVFALLFQPALGSLLIKTHPPVTKEELKSIKGMEDGPLSDIKGFIGGYIKLLQHFLKKPWTFVGSILGLMICVVIVFIKFSVGVEFFPSVEPDNVTVIVRSTGNLSIWQQSALMKEVENKIFKFNDSVKVFYTKAGAVNNSHQLPDDTIGLIQLELADWNRRDKASILLDKMSAATSDIGGIIVQMQQERAGPVSGKQIQMNIFSSNYDKAMQFTKKLKSAMLNEIKGFKDLNDSLPIPGIEWNIKIDRELAAKYLLNSTDIGNVLRMATSGLKISTCRLDDLDYEVDILVRFPEASRLVSQLSNLRIVNTNGNIIPMNKVAVQTPQPQLSLIKRVNKEDVFTIDSDIEIGRLVDNQIKDIKKWLNNNLEEGTKVEFKGDAEDQQKTSIFLRNAFLFILAMTFLIMLTQFNNFYDAGVVMSAVFLSITGVLIGLLVTGRPFGIVMCGIGIMALAGIVLNNNILMVDSFHHLQKNGHDTMDAIVRAGAQRIRPILLTAGAAILGLLPMATSITLDFMNRTVTHGAPSTQWWTQLATTICGGLTFATVLTLFFTPCLLAIRYHRK
jgi:multidrug efflux pump